jgi:molybdate transport system substrate-binding protein
LRLRRGTAVAAVVAIIALGACSSKAGRDVTLKVFAAQSVSPAFADLKAAFENDHPHTKLDGVFGGSSTLVTQLQQGAPADVFISADQTNMAKVVDGKLTRGASAVVAHNRLEIVVAAGNPKHVATLADLGGKGLVISLCDAAVPCGKYAGDAFAKAGVAVPSASRETSVAGVVTKVSTGNADAGIVYVTDVKAAGAKVAGVAIPATQNVVADYPAVALKQSAHAKQVDAFLAFLRSAVAKRVLRGYGFEA